MTEKVKLEVAVVGFESKSFIEDEYKNKEAFDSF